MIHMAAQRGSITEAFETLVDLQHAGLIRHLGVLGAVLRRYVRQPELAPAGADLAELLGRSARLGSFVVPVQPNERLGAGDRAECELVRLGFGEYRAGEESGPDNIGLGQ
ncbi:hypothetical protein ACH4LZ_01160 [Streptomyces halstedii]|uniref:hypothetical protein n=1 Tax=Streptomyces halstedii TaxID=1944 RepID=UPI0037A469C8